MGYKGIIGVSVSIIFFIFLLMKHDHPGNFACTGPGGYICWSWSWSSSEESEISERITSIKNYSNNRSQIYEFKGDLRIHAKSPTVFVVVSPKQQPESVPNSWTIRPYARQKFVNTPITNINVRITSESGAPPNCTKRFQIPAIVFSLGGSLNPYHGIADVILPLYFTSRQFNGSVVFLVLDLKPEVISRYKLILEGLSHHDIVRLGKDVGVMCFSQVIVGLDANDEELKPGPRHFSDGTMKDFTGFIRSTYSLRRQTIRRKDEQPPRVLIISRERTRRMTNVDDVASTCRRVGFDVAVREISGGDGLETVGDYVNSFDALVGVHGAGLTNMIFLPDNAVVVQIVPYGYGSMAREYYGDPTAEMNLRYVEYKVRWSESSLAMKYSRDSEVCLDPDGIRARSRDTFADIYKEADVTVDVARFEPTVVTAFHHLL